MRADAARASGKSSEALGKQGMALPHEVAQGHGLFPAFCGPTKKIFVFGKRRFAFSRSPTWRGLSQRGTSQYRTTDSLTVAVQLGLER
jgi:hypothetical protein